MKIAKEDILDGFVELKQKVKNELKEVATRIKEVKKKMKTLQRRGQLCHEEISIIYMNKWDFRHKHVAYCQFFNNTPYGAIENPSRNNPLYKPRVEKFMKEWMDELNEDVRNCA